jgi:hypothetical protein
MSETYSYYPDYGSVIRDSDGKLISPCQSAEDQDFLDYLAWVQDGNQPSAPPDPAPSALLEAKQTLTDIVQAYMDLTVKERGYDTILSLCSYATSTVPQFRAEAQAGVLWRDQCWSYGYGILAQVLAGQRAIPTVEEVMAELPQIKWPTSW